MASKSTDAAAATTDRPTFTVVAGDCRIEADMEDHRTYRGQVLVIAKPDDTVLVHDIEGYQPVAWLTRAERVVIDDDAGTITAVDGDRWLRIQIVASLLDRRLPGTVVGTPVANCPDCGGRLIDAGDAVHCVSCRTRYGLPRDGVIVGSRCECGLPRMRIERGDAFELCIDRECDPMAEAIAERFDGTWRCPDEGCDGTLRVVRRRNLMLACDAYPDCEVAFQFPAGVIDGHCGCGLPRFATAEGSRCLDRSCGAPA